ncbi:LytTR family DNA-binding domain-containing protein [Aquimarina sp. MMG016]|uniref:LytR/AlgR family response regulator transcription factor n=1 Tax=Aquimarina sp. MMG016 TaxID=2822690 RepID=UPI001B3A5ABE|nr:LytTR family DNA-binding domain-containing protein [Aquimarina sp. MMG016]MBQ4821648.1 response regulator transcription factor [Aquimarina sp. MMG016]
MVLKCIVIDDEPLARECISNYIKEVDFLELQGSCNNPLEITKIKNSHEADLLFLDIQMPRMNGIEFLKSMKSKPMVVITTAFPNYALDGFDLDVMDYLLKPITFTRFFKAVCKVKEQHLLIQNKPGVTQNQENSKPDHVFIKCENTYKKIYFDDILFIKSMQNYVGFHTTDGKKHLSLIPLKEVAKQLDSEIFMQVHKSFIVCIPKIEAVEKEGIIIGSHYIPLGRNYRTSIMKKIVNDRILKR